MINTTTAPHYTWGAACDGWRLVQAEGLSVIQERMPPGTAEVRHYHARARQFFYVLAGTLTIELDGTRHVLRPGDGVEVAPGAPHQVLNESDADAGFLVISQPPRRRIGWGLPLEEILPVVPDHFSGTIPFVRPNKHQRTQWFVESTFGD